MGVAQSLYANSEPKSCTSRCRWMKPVGGDRHKRRTWWGGGPLHPPVRHARICNCVLLNCKVPYSLPNTIRISTGRGVHTTVLYIKFIVWHLLRVYTHASFSVKFVFLAVRDIWICSSPQMGTSFYMPHDTPLPAAAPTMVCNVLVPLAISEKLWVISSCKKHVQHELVRDWWEHY